MIVVNPIAITSAVIVSSNVLEDEWPLYSDIAIYNKGDKVILLSEHKIYECLIDETSGVSPVGSTVWLDSGATNKFKSFDGKNLTKTMQAGTIEFSIKSGTLINSLGFIGVVAKSIQIVVTDPAEGVVSDKTYSMTDYSADGLYDYFFTPIIVKSRLYVADLPPYPRATIKIIIAQESSAEVATIIAGVQHRLGQMEWDYSVGINDYSLVEFKPLEEPLLVQRGYSDTLNLNVSIPTNSVNRIKEKLTKLRAKRVLWVGHKDRPESIIYGIYKDFNIVVPGQIKSKCSLKIQGTT